MKRHDGDTTSRPSAALGSNVMVQVYLHPSGIGSNVWIAVTAIGRLGLVPFITMRLPGTHSATTDSIVVGTPHARIRILTRTPTRIGTSSGRYSITAGSMSGAVVGSARKSNANVGGTQRVIVSENRTGRIRTVCCTPARAFDAGQVPVGETLSHPLTMMGV